MKKIDVKEFIESSLDGTIVRYDNPNCENCNECCTIFACISKEEYTNLKKYLTKNKRGKIIYDTALKRVLKKCKELDGLYLICPFSNGLKKCDIYNKRPLVCRDFNCRTTEEGNKANTYGDTHLFELFAEDLRKDKDFLRIYKNSLGSINPLDLLNL